MREVEEIPSRLETRTDALVVALADRPWTLVALVLAYGAALGGGFVLGLLAGGC